MGMRDKSSTGPGVCLKFLVLGTNFMFVLLGLAVIGVCIWLLLEGNHWFNTLMIAGAWIAVVAGGVVVLALLVGCLGACMEVKGMLLCNIVTLATLGLTLIAGGVVAVVCRDQLKQEFCVEMGRIISKSYGVDQDEWWNRQLTQRWDQTQVKLQCCGVGEHFPWKIYQESSWRKSNPEPTKQYVPVSCCMLDSSGKMIDRVRCQSFNQGPPTKDTGETNTALHYRDCCNSIEHYVSDHALYIVALAFGTAIALIFALCMTILLYRQLE